MSTEDDAHNVTRTLPQRRLTVRPVTVRVIQGLTAGSTARMDGPHLVIGSGPSADFSLPDPGVSREHLRLSIVPGGVRLRDPDSKNGTHLGAIRVRDMVLTRPAALRLGQVEIELAFEGDPVELVLSEQTSFGRAIGHSLAMRWVFAQLERVASSDATVLLEGETGVGKDVLAHAVHEASTRADKPFVVADCAAIPKHLIESELFGHERGAFTGAERPRRGLFEAADGETIFLDEIGELPIDLQPKLLRVLEQREIRPVGSNRILPVDVRILAATNRRLGGSDAATFRRDLYYRLAVVRIAVPPLRERREDIVPIARSMLQDSRKDVGADFPPEFCAMLEAYDWPGNVRELRSAVDRFVALGKECGDLLVTRADSTAGLVRLAYAEAREIVLDRFERNYVDQTLAQADGVVTRAAETSGPAERATSESNAGRSRTQTPPGRRRRRIV
jgi:transcriptional regulator with GAF, ATPase, and Fis domain